MSARALLLVLLLGAAAACDQTPKADPSKPEAFAKLTALQPAAGGRLQRVTLPPAMLVAVRRDDLGDVRVFDARDRVVPLALVDQVADGPRRGVEVPVYPVIGSTDDLASSDLSIRVEGDGVARAVIVDRSSAAKDADPPAAVLLDTRKVRDPASAIVLRADIPAGRPITLTLLTSANLKDWDRLATKVLFRPVDGAALLGGAEVALDGANLRDRYIGISWGGASGVKLTGASVITSAVRPAAPAAVAATAPSLADPHSLRFDLPSMALLSGIRVTPARGDGVLPVELLGRDNAEKPWALLTATTLQPEGGANIIALTHAPMANYRLVADKRTAGFSAPPKLELLFEPIELLVALSGSPPYRLAAGQASARGSYLSPAEIASQGERLDLAGLPQATLAAATEAPPVVALQAGVSDGALDPRKMALWAALLLGTLVLAFAAYRLLRANASDPSQTKDGGH